MGGILVVPFRHKDDRRQQLREDELPRISMEGGKRYRKRLLAIVVTTIALWALIYATARLFFL